MRGQGGCLDLHKDSGQLALRKAGLYEEFLKHARPEGETLRIFDPDGKVLLDESAEDGGSRPADFEGRPEIDRAKLREILLDSLEPGSIHWNAKLEQVKLSWNQKYDLHFQDRVETSFDMVIGADGAWSKVRELLSEEKPFYAGVGGLDCRISAIDTAHPSLSKRVGQGMCLTLGQDKGILAQRNGDGSVRLYGFARVPEAWYNKWDLEALPAEMVKEQVVNEWFADWQEEAKDLILKSDAEIAMRPMYMLPIGFKWTRAPG